MMPRLSVSGLTFQRGHRTVLTEVSLSVEQSDRLAVLGPNGAGKTTLLLQMGGLLRPTAGTIAFDGHPLESGSNARRRWRPHIGVLFQDPSDQLFGPQVLDDVAIGPRNAGASISEARARAERMLEQLHLRHLADHPVHALSVGEQRMVALAGVLVMQPAVLLLDEPTAGLDAGAEDHLMRALHAASAQGISMVMATHDADLAFQWATRIALMVDGRVVAEGPPLAMSDSSWLARAGVRRPWAMDAWRELVRLGVLSPGLPARSGTELVARLLCQPTLQDLHLRDLA